MERPLSGACPISNLHRFRPKCYTLINKLYDPKKDIRENRIRLNTWTDKLDDAIPDLVEFNRVYENIHTYIDCDTFPDIDISFMLIIKITIKINRLVKNIREEEH